MSGAETLTSDVDLDVAGLFSEIWRKKWLVLAITLAVGAGLFVALSLSPPRYKASARVLIEKRESVFTRQNDGDFNLSTSQFDEQAIGSQVQVLTADDIALRVIDKLQLTKAPEFSGDAGPGLLDSLMSALPVGKPASSGTPQERMLDTFRKRLLVYAADKSRVLVVEFWGYDPELAQNVSNALVDEYLALTKQAKLEAESQATGWLGPEIDDLRAKVRAAEAKVAEFRGNSDILIGNNNALLATQQLSEASSELTRLRSDKSAAESKVAAIRAALAGGGSLDAIPEVIASPLIQRLRERQVSLRGEISQLETTLLPGHPKLKALKSQVGDFDAQIRAAAANILKSLENNVVLARKQETVLLDEVERLKAEAARVGEAEVELRALEREANAQRELLESYLTRFREAASRQKGDYQPVDARIISRAILPTESYFPKVVPFTIAGATVAAVLTIVGILSWALLSGRALRPVAAARIGRSPDPGFEEPQFAEVTRDRPLSVAAPGRSAKLRQVEAPALQSDIPDAEIPLADDGAPAVAPLTPEFEQFRPHDAVAAIRALGSGIVAVISPRGGSPITVDIARELETSRTRVAVIDLSADGSVTAEFLGQGTRHGLSELAQGRCGFAEAVYADPLSSVQIMPAGDMARPEAALPFERVREIVAAMAESFDYLVIDCGDAGGDTLFGLLPLTSLVLVDSDTLGAADVAARVSDFARRGFRETIAIAA